MAIKISSDAFVILLIVVIAFLYYRYPRLRKGHKDDEEDSENEMVDKMKIVVEELARQDYFKYTDYQHYKEAMLIAAEQLAEGGFDCTLHEHEEPQFASLDYRQSRLAGSDLDSYDGYIWAIEAMKEGFTRIGLMIKSIKGRDEKSEEDDFDDWDGEDDIDLLHEDEYKLNINNKEYPLFANHSGENNHQKWLNVKTLAEIINDQLVLQGKDERVYLSKDVCDEYGGHCAFMTASQYAIIAPCMNESNAESIWSVEDWSQMHGLSTGTGIGQ